MSRALGYGQISLYLRCLREWTTDIVRQTYAKRSQAGFSMTSGMRTQNTTCEVSLQASSNNVQAHWPAWCSALMSIGDWDYLLGSIQRGSALHLAARRGNLTILKTLYECDATRLDKPNAVGERIPLRSYVAARKDHLRIVRCLSNKRSARYAI